MIIFRMILKMRLEHYLVKTSSSTSSKTQEEENDVKANIESAQSPLLSSKNVHDPSGRLLFREFVEILVRLSFFHVSHIIF